MTSTVQPSGKELSRSLATGYLAVVALVWLSALALLVLWLVTGRNSWSTDNAAVALPGFVVIAGAVAVIWVVDRTLHRGRPAITQSFRMLGLSYGSAVPVAWRTLHR